MTIKGFHDKLYAFYNGIVPSIEPIDNNRPCSVIRLIRLFMTQFTVPTLLEGPTTRFPIYNTGWGQMVSDKEYQVEGAYPYLLISNIPLTKKCLLNEWDRLSDETAGKTISNFLGACAHCQLPKVHLSYNIWYVFRRYSKQTVTHLGERTSLYRIWFWKFLLFRMISSDFWRDDDTNWIIYSISTGFG